MSAADILQNKATLLSAIFRSVSRTPIKRWAVSADRKGPKSESPRISNSDFRPSHSSSYSKWPYNRLWGELTPNIPQSGVIGNINRVAWPMRGSSGLNSLVTIHAHRKTCTGLNRSGFHPEYFLPKHSFGSINLGNTRAFLLPI